MSLSIVVGQPGFYGQIDIGDYPRPPLLYRRPIAIERVERDRPPIYLRVPPAHASNWKRYCRAYGACGERVYFVENGWYQREFIPRYQERHGERRDAYRDERWPDHRDEPRRDRQNPHQDQNHQR